MPNPTPELPEDIRVEIYKEAEAKYSKLPPTFKGGAIRAYRDGAEQHHALYLNSERRRKEAMELLEPILDWGQGNPELKLGTSITKEVLERAKGFSVLRDALERITRMSETHGRPDCKWGDTDFNSAAVAYGQNLLLEDVKHMASKALALFPVDKKKEE